MINRRQFHQTVTASAAALALGETAPNAASAGPASLSLDPLPAGAVARLGCNRLWHLWPASNPGLNDLTFSPDGRYLATLGHQDDHVGIWSVPDGMAIRDWEPQEADRGGSLLWTEQGLYISSGGGLSLWEPMTASLIHRFAGELLRGLAVSVDRRHVAAAAFIEGCVQLWDTSTRLPVARLETDPDRKPGPPFRLGNILLSVAFSRCGRWLAAGGYNHGQTGRIEGFVHCWDIAARRHLIRFETNGGPVGRLAFTPTGHLLTADWAGTIALWEPLEGRWVRDWPRPGVGNIYHSLAVNASGQIALQREEGVYLWHPDPSRETVLCPARGFSNLAYSDDGRFVAGGRRNGRVDLYDATTGGDLSPPDRHTTHVGSIELSADGTVCLVCLGYISPHHANEIVLRDTRTGAWLGATPPADWRPLALAPVGTRVAGRLGGSRLAVWDWASGEVTVHPEVDPQVVAWHPDGQRLVVAANNGDVVTWHRATGQWNRQPVSSSVPMMGVAVAAGGRAVALNGNGSLFVWQIDQDDSPRRLAVPPPPSQPDYVSARCLLALAPDGLSVAWTYSDGIVYASSVADDELRSVYTHPTGDEEAEDGRSVILRYTAAGRLLIAGTCTTQDTHWLYTSVVTDGLTGEVLWRSPPQLQWASAMALSPDGRALLTGHEDGTLLVWPLRPGS
jgi:WD40 repeat protein